MHFRESPAVFFNPMYVQVSRVTPCDYNKSIFSFNPVKNQSETFRVLLINNIQKAFFLFRPPISSVRSFVFKGLDLESHMRGGKGNDAVSEGGGTHQHPQKLSSQTVGENGRWSRAGSEYFTFLMEFSCFIYQKYAHWKYLIFFEEQQ